MKKDIVLIVGGGGMAGVFSAGVLKSFEREDFFERVHSVYAVSVGGCNAARFLVKQSALGGETYWTHFNDERFIKKHFVKYFFGVVRKRPVADLLDFNYFKKIILDSEDKIDMQAVTTSIPLYTKVFDLSQNQHKYIHVKEPAAYDKVMASATLSPLTSVNVQIQDGIYIDGDAIASDIDKQVATEHADKTVIKIVNHKPSLLDTLNVGVLVVVYFLFKSMYGKKVANIYASNFFKKDHWDRKLTKCKNVYQIVNTSNISLFCTNEEKLRRVYQNGEAQGLEFLKELPQTVSVER